jgi:hypothetical protein
MQRNLTNNKWAKRRPTFSSEPDRTNENNADRSNAFAQIGQKYRMVGQKVK